MNVRYYADPRTELPHIYGHDAFVITACDLRGAPLLAHRRRMRRKPQ